MSELNFTKLADAPILEEVPDGAKVYAEVEGKVYRVAGDNLGGGGIPTAIFHLNTDTAEEKNAKASGPIYTATCDNMTFAECLALFQAGESVNARLVVDQPISSGQVYEDAPSISGGMADINGQSFIGFTFSSVIVSMLDDSGTFYWFSDGTITTDMSAIGG